MSASVLLLHALGSSHRMWRAQARVLGGRYDLIVPDLPGHGVVPGPFTFASAVAQTRRLLGDRTDPVHVVGVSLGANVALQLALAEPGRVASLLLSGAAVRLPPAAVGLQRAVTAALPLRALAALAVRAADPAEDRDRRALAEDVRRAGKRTQAEALRALAAADLEPRLGSIAAPALVCCGTEDRANLPSARLLAERLPGAELRTVPGGHLWNLREPERCTEIVEAFLAERSG